MQAQLLTGQLSHLRDSIESRLKERADSLEHHKRLEAERLNLLKAQIEANRRMAEDQEERIRKIDDAAIANRTCMIVMLVLLAMAASSPRPSPPGWEAVDPG